MNKQPRRASGHDAAIKREKDKSLKNHNSIAGSRHSTCPVRDGVLTAFCSEERLNRLKGGSRPFPFTIEEKIQSYAHLFLIGAAGYLQFINLVRQVKFVMTDSGASRGRPRI